MQSAAIGAALELAGIDSYRLQGFATSNGEAAAHDFVYVPQYDQIIHNGFMPNVKGTMICPSKIGDGYKYIDFIEHDGKWAYLWRLYYCSPFYGTLSPNETMEILDYLKGIHSDDIQGRKVERRQFMKIPFEQVKQLLVNEQGGWKPYELPPKRLP